MSEQYHVWRINDGEVHWVVAMSKSEALEYHGVDVLGYATVLEYAADMGPVRIKRLWPHEKISVTNEDGIVVEKRAREWVTEGSGVFCSTVW